MSVEAKDHISSQENEGFVIEKENGRAKWSPLKAKKDWFRIVFLAGFWVLWTWVTITVTRHGFTQPSEGDKLFFVWGWVFSAWILFYFIKALLPARIEFKDDKLVFRERTVFGGRICVIPVREITKIGFGLRGRGSQTTLTIVSKGSFFWSKKEDIGGFLSLKLKRELFALLRSWVTVETSPVSFFPYGD